MVQDTILPTIPFHAMTKPVGPVCNLNCTYCFYLEKTNLFDHDSQFRMSDEVLEEYIRQYIASQATPEINFAWQGGEPTLLGVPFFEKVIELQEKHANGKQITNAIQTNGTLLNDEWGAFLAKHKFLVGVSIDGPAKLHDIYRVDRRDLPTFDRVMHGINMLKKHGAEFNTLTVVNRENVKHPLEVYNFLKEVGSGFIQFIPLVEREADSEGESLGLGLATPSDGASDDGVRVTDWSVPALAYGKFLSTVFDEWVRRDVGEVFVQMFDVALGNWAGAGSSLCVFAKECGRAIAVEHNGDVFSCDHYVYPRYRLGNLMDTPLGAMADSPQQEKFGKDKSDTLPRQCRECTYRFACNGECPKHRFMKTPDGEPGLNYLCPSYKHFFKHVDPYMQTMARLVRSRRPAAAIMDMLKQQDRAPTRPPSRSGPCPCGSGKKFKRCCGQQ